MTRSELLEALSLDFDYTMRCIGTAMSDLAPLKGVAAVDQVIANLDAAYDAVDRAGNLRKALER